LKASLLDHTKAQPSTIFRGAAICLLFFFNLPGLTAEDLVTESATQISEADGADLFRVDQLIAAEQWDEAVDAMIDVMQRAAAADLAKQSFISLDPSTEQSAAYRRFLPLLTACQIKVARWHVTAPRAFELYRQRIETTTEKRFDEVLKKPSIGELEQLISRYAVSAQADEAMLALGSYHLEAARFQRARECWELINPVFRLPAGLENLSTLPVGAPAWLALGEVDWAVHGDAIKAAFEQQLTSAHFDQAIPQLRFPGSQLDVSSVAARLVLASILEGPQSRAEIELRIFKLLFPEKTGLISGKQGVLQEMLSELLLQSRDWQPVKNSEDWKTFAGSPARNRFAVGAVDPSGKPIWTVDLNLQSADSEVIGLGRPRIGESELGVLAYYPVIVNNTVIWHDGDTVRAIDLLTGAAKWPFDEAIEALPDRRGEVWRPAIADIPSRSPRTKIGTVRFTSTADQSHFFARIGNPLTGVQDDEPRPRSALIGLDLNRQGKLMPGFLLRPEVDQFEFEGSPLVSGSRLFVAMRETAPRSSRVTLHVACFEIPALRSAERCRQLWRVPVCTADSPAGGRYDEITHVLLTEVDGTIYCNTNLGAIAALSAADGRPRWIAKYSRRAFAADEPNKIVDNYFRDLNPCLFWQGTLYVAPMDTDQIFAIDAATGMLLWSTSAASVNQLLGATDRSLIVAGTAIFWLDIRTGRIQTGFPNMAISSPPGHARSEEIGRGRGIMTADAVYWPTRDKIYVFDHAPRLAGGDQGQTVAYPQRKQTIDLRLRGLSGGNLLISGDILLIASENRLVAFNATGRVEKPKN